MTKKKKIPRYQLQLIQDYDHSWLLFVWTPVTRPEMRIDEWSHKYGIVAQLGYVMTVSNLLYSYQKNLKIDPDEF